MTKVKKSWKNTNICGSKQKKKTRSHVELSHSQTKNFPPQEKEDEILTGIIFLWLLFSSQPSWFGNFSEIKIKSLSSFRTSLKSLHPFNLHITILHPWRLKIIAIFAKYICFFEDLDRLLQLYWLKQTSPGSWLNV